MMKSRMLTAAVLFGTSLTIFSAAAFADNVPTTPEPLVTAYSFLNGEEQLLTTAYDEGVNAGFSDTKMVFRLFTVPRASRVRLFLCFKPAGYHFVSLQANCEGQRVEGMYGYLEKVRSATAPTEVVTCSNGSARRVSNDPQACTSEGFTVKGVLGYAAP
jgi:hypothetical protein